MTDKMLQVIVISSVHPAPTSAGPIVLHRHLVNQQELGLVVYGHEPTDNSLRSWLRRGFGWLGKAGFPGLAENFWALWGGRWLDPLLSRVAVDGKAVVLTVGQGDLFPAAMRFARRHNLPLISIFHDWWPDMPAVHPWPRRVLERRFRALCAQSAAVLCVSEGMLKALGEHPNRQLLYPIPEDRSGRGTSHPSTEKGAEDGSLKIVYAGNLQDYGSMLGAALDTLRDHRQLRCEVRGNKPSWPAELSEKLKANGSWLPFAPRPEFESWLAGADAFLVPMEFDPALRRRMETSFPSKIPEFVQFGKPLVIWGPEYCSAIHWARQGDRALCVTDPSPSALRAALEGLAASKALRQRLSSESRLAALEEFDPVGIQAQLLAILENAGHSSTRDDPAAILTDLATPFRQ